MSTMVRDPGTGPHRGGVEHLRVRGWIIPLLGLSFLVMGVFGGDPPRAESGEPSIGTPPLPDSASAGDAPDPCALPPVLPTASGVQDPVFAILLALIEGDLCGTISADRMRREIAETGRSSRIPVEYLKEVRRSVFEGSPHAEVVLISKDDINVPIPYRVLVYHPGSMRASRVLELDEWSLGTVRIKGPRRKDGTRIPVVLEDVRLWGIRRGSVMLDVDGWLDKVMGSRLDDTRMVGFALFRYGGQRLGMAMGYNPEGKGRSGTFHFERDSILFPNPPQLRAAGAHLRARLERLMPAAAARRRS